MLVELSRGRTRRPARPDMSKGGHGAAAANVLLLKKSEETRRQENMREAIKARFMGPCDISCFLLNPSLVSSMTLSQKQSLD